MKNNKTHNLFYEENNFMKSTKNLIIITIVILIAIILVKFLPKNDNKKVINGNNKSIQEIEEYLLNINSYKAIIEVKVKSNKNENTYILKQQVKDNTCIQEVLEPKSMEGTIITYKEGTLEIKNTNLNISKIYENYPYISNNTLFLNDFINEYKNDEKRKIEETQEAIIMKIETQERYKKKQNLYVDRKTLKPKTFEIIDMNENEKVYITYNEIELNI